NLSVRASSQPGLIRSLPIIRRNNMPKGESMSVNIASKDHFCNKTNYNSHAPHLRCIAGGDNVTSPSPDQTLRFPVAKGPFLAMAPRNVGKALATKVASGISSFLSSERSNIIYIVVHSFESLDTA